eukprot:TRINITY_DN26219_c0_g1_i3.p1 TRINITY_DN26219_c0_g1~~TRINITY_DN26219_c0_g1_i3.p1  ORF type:complete len:353 (-),score=107.62 TRINITY_DN26219_c0_g1_i3:395-1390(-)
MAAVMGAQPRLVEFAEGEVEDDVREWLEAGWASDSDAEPQPVKQVAAGTEACETAAAASTLLALTTSVEEILLVLLRAVCQRMDDAGVAYWMCGGTLIGALRHGGFVPHDDDVDLECLEEDWPKLEAACERAAEKPCGLARLYCRRGGRWRQTPVAHIGFRGAEDVELDVFLRETALDEMKDFPVAAEVWPLQKLPFHGLQVSAPGNATSYLDRLYGPDWCRTVKVWTHSFNFFHGLGHNPDKVAVTLEDYKAMVQAAGYRAAPSMSMLREETTCLHTLIEGLFEADGPVEALKAAHQEDPLEAVRRKNREQAQARLDLEAASCQQDMPGT